MVFIYRDRPWLFTHTIDLANIDFGTEIIVPETPLVRIVTWHMQNVIDDVVERGMIGNATEIVFTICE